MRIILPIFSLFLILSCQQKPSEPIALSSAAMNDFASDVKNTPSVTVEVYAMGVSDFRTRQLRCEIVLIKAFHVAVASSLVQFLNQDNVGIGPCDFYRNPFGSVRGPDR